MSTCLSRSKRVVERKLGREKASGVRDRSAEGTSAFLQADLRHARRFIFLRYETALGTAVVGTPVFEALRRAVPEAHVTVACSGIAHAVLRHNPHIDEFWVTPHPAKHWIGCASSLVRLRLRNRRPVDCAVLDAGNRRTRYALLSFLTGARCRIGFRLSRDFMSASLRFDPGKSIAINNLSLLDLLGLPWKECPPAVYFSEADCEAVSQFFVGKGLEVTRPIVAMQTQTSGGHPNHWYDDRFVALADYVAGTWDGQIVFVGTDEEKERIDRIRGRMTNPSWNAAGLTSVTGLACLLAHSDLLITLDTGTMHVGRGVDVPMVVIGHAANPRHEWLSSSNERACVIRHDEIPCAGCRRRYCTTRECMDYLTVDEAARGVDLQLTRFAPSGASRQSRVTKRLDPRGGPRQLPGLATSAERSSGPPGQPP